MILALSAKLILYYADSFCEVRSTVPRQRGRKKRGGDCRFSFRTLPLLIGSVAFRSISSIVFSIDSIAQFIFFNTSSSVNRST
jgi:hypothetical protein